MPELRFIIVVTEQHDEVPLLQKLGEGSSRLATWASESLALTFIQSHHLSENSRVVLLTSETQKFWHSKMPESGIEIVE